MNDVIVAFEDRNDAPEGYYPKINRTCLFRASQPNASYDPPRQYYLAAVPHAASKTWISEDQAAKLLETWSKASE